MPQKPPLCRSKIRCFCHDIPHIPSWQELNCLVPVPVYCAGDRLERRMILSAGANDHCSMTPFGIPDEVCHLVSFNAENAAIILQCVLSRGVMCSFSA